MLGFLLATGRVSLLATGAVSLLATGAVSLLANGAVSLLANGAVSLLANGAVSPPYLKSKIKKLLFKKKSFQPTLPTLKRLKPYR